MEHLQQSLFTQQVAENQSVWMVHTSCSGSCPNRVCHQASNTAPGPISIVYVYKHAPSINTQNTKLSPSNGIPTHYKKQQRLVPTQLAVACFVAVYLKQKTPPPLSVFVKVARGLRTDVIRHTKTALGADQNCAANPPKTRMPHTNTHCSRLLFYAKYKHLLRLCQRCRS